MFALHKSIFTSGKRWSILAWLLFFDLSNKRGSTRTLHSTGKALRVIKSHKLRYCCKDWTLWWWSPSTTRYFGSVSHWFCSLPLIHSHHCMQFLTEYMNIYIYFVAGNWKRIMSIIDFDKKYTPTHVLSAFVSVSISKGVPWQCVVCFCLFYIICF